MTATALSFSIITRKFFSHGDISGHVPDGLSESLKTPRLNTALIRYTGIYGVTILLLL